MAMLDLIVRNARVVTASDEFAADIGVTRGVVTHLAQRLELDAAHEIDAAGRTVTSGGIDGHCHIDQPTTDGSVCADDFVSATRSAACGGTTTVIPFALQMKGMRLRDAVVWDGASPAGTPGRGLFLPCAAPARPAQRHVTDFRPA